MDLRWRQEQRRPPARSWLNFLHSNTDSEVCRLKDAIKIIPHNIAPPCPFLDWPGHTICALIPQSPKHIWVFYCTCTWTKMSPETACCVFLSLDMLLSIRLSMPVLRACRKCKGTRPLFDGRAASPILTLDMRHDSTAVDRLTDTPRNPLTLCGFSWLIRCCESLAH